MPENCHRDPRDVLVQDKFYTHLPDPLFDVIAEKRLPAAAILVLLTHLKAGAINGDYCSEIPIEAVAARCRISTSTVTRAYQLLIRLGLLRRADPGRDTARPHQQAVAVTEFRLPAGLLRELDRYPNRRRPPASSALPVPEDAHPSDPPASDPAPASAPVPLADPFAGLSGRERMAAQASLLGCMSKAERARYDQAFSQHESSMAFDTNSALTAEQQATVLQLLAILARPQPASTPVRTPCLGSSGDAPRPRRRLSMLELARIRHGLQAASGRTDVDELCRQIAWSVEEGALVKFPALHAIHIALKKVREGAWTRPHRMPPNWALNLSQRAPGAPTGHDSGAPVSRAGDRGTSIARQPAAESRGGAGMTAAAQILTGWRTTVRPN
ncbi:MAG: P-loop NTPase family protein [Steroidobacteraceae bacterium]